VVYATCSSEPEENDRVVAGFLAERSDFRLADPRAQDPRPAGLPADVLDDSGCLRTLPWRHGLEPFFAAMLVKAKHL
jgi:16S rRNA (cytosine967-C5)-methyltransferase